MRALALAAALTLAAGLAEAAPAPSAASVQASIARNGAKAAVRDLVKQGRFEAVLTQVETGEAAWLAVAGGLGPGVDAGDAESLAIAVARALPREPERVLAMADKSFALDSICTSPFIEPDAGVAERYEARTLKALGGVKTAGLKPVAARCAAKVKLPR